MKPGDLNSVANGRGHSNNGDGDARSVVKVGSDFYILASSLASRRKVRVLASGQSFAVFDVGGCIIESPLEALGFFHADTRYLSRFELRIAGKVPYYLNSFLSDDRAQLRINLTNPDLGSDGEISLPRDMIQVERGWSLVDSVLFHRIKLRNYAAAPISVPIDLFFNVDFADVFEVRGVKRERRGEILEPEIQNNTVRFEYHGLDKISRFTEIHFDSAPRALSNGRAAFVLNLGPDESAELEMRIVGGSERELARRRRKTPASFDQAVELRRSEIARARSGWARISASNELFDSMLKRSAADLTEIVSRSANGNFIMAGIPWFATLFGRDSLITMMSLLPFNPEIAARTLRTLAGLRGMRNEGARDEQPGKIVHEIRGGEMAATGEVPFARYYGSVDSTPLFLWLLGRWVATTGNLDLARELWPAVESALQWIERWGDRDGDGYVEYIRETQHGLANQGWKDSSDAVSHADGRLARPPIALCEVQGYVYAAYTSIADVAARLGFGEMAGRLAERAIALRGAFTRDFWLDDLGTVALALDGDKQPCRVMTSNAAHCLATGLLDGDQAGALSDHLMADEMFSGWGVRTLGQSERRYNPMSYHNGSVWPHDNAIAAFGLGRYGRRAQACRILEGMFHAACQLETASLPELFCGFTREQRLGPVPYPVACYPQAWSAASVFMMLQAVLGLQVMGFEHRVVIDSPEIPPWLEWLRIEDLQVGPGSVSLVLRRASRGGVMVEVVEKRGPISVEVKR
ncbi:MAG: amylo-alpha-1,6-glucosidase [Candidatus Binataceae bacterium]|nr:amylo-alpha-1,6-glucosidase [Candidatus Binataceae bacterium]